jgi:ABC-type enterobactin transport system permease subunit
MVGTTSLKTLTRLLLLLLLLLLDANAALAAGVVAFIALGVIDIGVSFLDS